MAHNKKSPFAMWLEYAALRGLSLLVNILPYRIACCIGCGLARFALFCGYQRSRTLNRIKLCFPDKTSREVYAIARFSLQNVVLTGIEMFRAPRINKNWITHHVKDIAHYVNELQKVLNEGHGAVIMVPHCGNWYMAAWAMSFYGIQLSAISAKQRNPYISRWLIQQFGYIDVIVRGSCAGLSESIARIKSGRALAILPDLRCPTPDVSVPFFNGVANVSRGGAFFAVSANAPIVVAIMRRKNGYHTFDHLATLHPDPNATDKNQEARRLTQEVFKLLNKGICATPEQWFWYNKRWILQPVKSK